MSVKMREHEVVVFLCQPTFPFNMILYFGETALLDHRNRCVTLNMDDHIGLKP